MEFTKCSIDSLEENAVLLSMRIFSPICILLWGAVGTGKTVFARAFIRSYYKNKTLRVISPAFTIIQTYSENEECPGFSKFDIWHLDLYRIEKTNEIQELGLDEALEKNICIIEWPEKFEKLPNKKIINVYLSTVSENLRNIKIEELN
ncbi:MAG: tRNA (adenosine(37)-N6)-threonylcarbamoyltransferase complex ATPase subunit type 1 TsaE [Holosporales bacterium]|jgi:tRNA threonylcarbamoyl adenosine modification protein YjeE|nr:tRNA (adenosine(37)-N6)-threonylcarbamoyltransferase complex ATPase subunit type 1 TsaE [Holosporales bacterium]